jgi:prolyl oligopeptidase
MTRLLPSRLLAIVTATVLSWAVALSAHAPQAPPAAALHPIVDDYFGTKVTDNYRYMENLKDPQVQAWMKSQADHTGRVLDSLSGRLALLKRIHELYSADSHVGDVVRRGQRYFYLETEPNALLPKLYYRDGLAGEPRLLIDPATLGRGTATHYALDFYEPSWDGRYLAYGLSSGGSEQSVLHVLEVARGTILPESIDRTSDSVVSWRPDNRSLLYMRDFKTTPQKPPAQVVYKGRT